MQFFPAPSTKGRVVVTTERTLIRAAGIGCVVLGLGGCAHAYTPIAQDFGVCGRTSNVGSFNIQKGIDADYGTVTYKGSVIYVYIGRHPELNSINVDASKIGDNIRLLYSVTIGNGKQYQSLYGYANKVMVGNVKTIDAIFITLTAKDSPVNRKQISAVGTNFVRCR